MPQDKIEQMTAKNAISYITVAILILFNSSHVVMRTLLYLIIRK